MKDLSKLSKCLEHYVLSKIEYRIRKEFVVKAPINPDKRLAICLYCLAWGDYLYTIGEMVGLAESTLCQIVVGVCTVIIEEL